MKRLQDKLESGDLFNKKSKQTMSIMNEIINTPGLQHIIERIFFNLDFEDLMNFHLVNKALKQILDQWIDVKPMSWLNKWRSNRGLSEKNKLDWTRALQMTKDTILRVNVALYIRNVIKIGHFVDVPCYIHNDVLNKATKISFEEALQQKDAGVLQILASKALARIVSTPNRKLFKVLQLNENRPEYLHIDVVKVLAPLIENLNASDKIGITPIHHATYNRQLDVVRFLAPLTETPNVPDQNGITPINLASFLGQVDIIKFLAPLTATPNAPDIRGLTPIHVAASKENLEIIKFLVPLTDGPNAPDKNGKTPIHFAASKENLEIIKFLVPFTDSPNAPDKNGKTPIHIAAWIGNIEIIRYLAPLTDDPNARDKNGKTSMDYAIKRGNNDIAQYLHSYV